MTRGKNAQPAVDPKQMAQMMAMMSRVMAGELPTVGFMNPGNMKYDKVYHPYKLKQLREEIKQHHEESWRHYPGHSKSTIENINRKIEEIGKRLRELRKESPKNRDERKNYYNTNGNGVIGRNSAGRIVEALNEERSEIFRISHGVRNRDGSERTTEFLNNILPKFHKPKFMEESQEYSLKKMLSWLKATKRKAFSLIETHIALNTLPESEMDGNTHGRVERTHEMTEFRKHFRAAQKAIHELRMMRNKNKPKEGGEGKKSRKKRKPRRKNKKPKTESAFSLTPFPDF